MTGTFIPFSDGTSNNTLTSSSSLLFNGASSEMAIGGSTVSNVSLKLADATKVFIPNSGTSVQRLLISPLAGALYFDTTIGTFFYGDGADWIQFSSASSVSASTTFVGIWASGQTVNVIGDKYTNTVTLFIPSVSATANTAALVTNTGTELPVSLRPTTSQIMPIFSLNDNSNFYLSGSIIVSSTGLITISLASAGMPRVKDGGTFTGSGTSGWTGFPVTYSLL